jgi:hypothetical protein
MYVPRRHISRDRLITDPPIQAEEQPGFIEAIMNILESEQDPGIRLSSQSAPY